MKTRTSLLPLLICVVSLSALAGCSDDLDDFFNEALNGEATALREPDMPNCSRVIHCCDRLQEDSFQTSVVPDAVRAACADDFEPAADTLIGYYVDGRSAIHDRNEVSDATRQGLLDDLRREAQGRVEPGCRCFLDETIGLIPAAALPVDCEPIEEVGALEEGAQCSDAITNMFDIASVGLGD